MNTMIHSQPAVRRENITIIRDTARVIARTLIPDDTVRLQRLIDRIVKLPDAAAVRTLEKVMNDYSRRHKDLMTILHRHFDEVKKIVPIPGGINETRKLLIGAYCTMEYSLESAALFNPSIVPHPDQSSLPAGSLRFIMSLRATGEGHISSIVFRSGTIDAASAIRFDPHSKLAEMPEIRRLSSDGDGNYSAVFSQGQELSERVIFPVLRTEIKGIEDARFVRFVEENGAATYYATYTAYDGFTILPQFIETKDFQTFNIVTLKGKGVKNKGMALFPRKIDGRYVMLSRQDGETNRIMISGDLHRWEEAEHLQEASSPWEFVQIGNCGSPLETKEGWLVLTHGVGPMRQYSIGAILLDLKNPQKVMARLEEPLLTPNEQEREGYVPNVVYSCGSLIHNNRLILPYAMSDITSGIATVELTDLLKAMR